MNYFENLAQLEDNPLLLPIIVKQVLGEEQAKKLKDPCTE